MKEEDVGEQLTGEADIYRVLRSLELTRSLLTIRFTNDHHAYSSLLIHTDLNASQFVVDELNPPEGNIKLKSGEAFTLIAFYDGVQVTFKNNTVIAPAAAHTHKQFNHAFTVDFPKSINHKQRRNAYRTHILNAVKTSISLSNDRAKPLQGKITDLSTTGIGCEFKGYVRPELVRGEVFEHCRIQINQEFELSCSLTTRYPRYDRSQDITHCGFEFDALDKAQQRQLDRYTLQVQREQRRDHR